MLLFFILLIYCITIQRFGGGPLFQQPPAWLPAAWATMGSQTGLLEASTPSLYAAMRQPELLQPQFSIDFLTYFNFLFFCTFFQLFSIFLEHLLRVSTLTFFPCSGREPSDCFITVIIILLDYYYHAIVIIIFSMATCTSRLQSSMGNVYETLKILINLSEAKKWPDHSARILKICEYYHIYMLV